MASDLGRDTAVAKLPSAPGWYTANVPDAWSFRTPSGGVLMTCALRAMTEELADPSLSIVSATTVFCAPVPAGPLELRVEVLRHGTAAAQVRAALSSTSVPGPGLEVTATFVRERAGPDVTDAEAPDVAAPSECPVIRETFPARFFENVEMHLARGTPWWNGLFEPSPARVDRWMRYRVPQRLGDGRLDPLALPPLVDLMPTALHQRLTNREPRYTFPSLDLTVHFLAPTSAEWLLTSTHARRARAGIASADVEVWDDRGQLVAYATQTMILRRRPRPSSPPPE
ncbi:thioesterase family protein [Myxococcota bacterium]|nr:thioesterase family protein [Myxococcota bacterium]